MKKLPFYFILFAIFLTGCGPVVNVDVDSICSPRAKEKNKFVILPGNEGCDDSDLQFQEFSNYTERALENSGFIKASSVNDADVAILLSYGVSDPHVYQYTYSSPVYGQTGYSSSSTHGTLNTFGNTAIYSGSTTYTPTYGIVGSTTNVGTGVLFVRHFVLNGIDIAKFNDSNKVIELWTTKAISAGESGDIRRVFPILLGASKDYIATNTGRKISLTLKENDKRVLEIKGVSY